MDDFKIKIGAQVEGKDLQPQIDKLAKGLKSLNIKVDSSSLKNVSVTYDEIAKTGKQIQTINAQLINQQGQLLSATVKVDNASGEIISTKTKLVQSTKTETAELNKQTQQIQKQASLISQMSKANTKLKMFDMDYSGVEQYSSKIKMLQSELTSVQGIKNIDEQSSAFAKVNNEIQLLNNELKIYKKSLAETSSDKLLSAQKKLNLETDQAYKTNTKFNDSLNITKTRADGATSSFNSYLKTLKPQALKSYSNEIKNISNSFSQASTSGNKVDLSKANASLSKFKSNMKDAGMETASFTTILKQNIGAFSQWLIIGNVIAGTMRNFKQAIENIKEVDTQLTEISKTSNLSGDALKQLGIDAYDSASKYGTTIQAYLAGFLEMSRGTDEATAKGLASLSILAQSAGDMTAELANNYIVATNAAFKYNNEVSKLNAVLDGQNQITNRNQVSMSDLAEATKVAGSQAAQSGIEVDQMTAAMGTMIASTKQGGDIAGRAFKGILMNLQQVSGEIDGEVFDTDSFKKVEESLNDVGVATEVIVDGTAKLRDPIETLKELASVYNSLPSDSVQKANIIADLGGKYRGNQLSGLLSNWETYEKMLSDYQNSSGSAASEAQKTADSLEGRLNKLTNTWNRTVANVVDSDILKTFVSIGTGAIDVADKMDLLQTTLIGLGGLGAYKALTSLIPMMKNAATSTIAFGTALNVVKAKDFIADTENLSKVVQGLSLSQATAVLSTQSLSAATIEATLLNAGFSTEEAKNTATTLAMASAQGVATGTTTTLGTSFKALGAAMAANPIGLIITGIVVAVSALSFGISKYKQSQEEMMTQMTDSSTTFKEQSNSIDEYEAKIKSLRETLDSSTSSTSEQSSAKDELLSIQDDLITSYSAEKSGLDLVNGSIDDQITKLQALTKEKANAYLNENLEGINKATGEMTKERHYNLGIGIIANSDEGKEIKSIAEQFKDQGIEIKQTAEGGEYYIHFYGDASQATDTINSFMTDVSGLKNKYKNSKVLDDVLGISSDELNKAQNVLDKYKDMYKTALTAQIITQVPTTDGVDPSTTFYEYTKAVETYNKALSDGSGVSKAKSNLDGLKGSIDEVLTKYPQFAPLFEDVALQIATTSSTATDGITDSTKTSQEALEEWAKTVGTITTNVTTLSDSLESLSKGQNLISSVNDDWEEFGQISTDTLQSIIDKYPELTDAVADYLAKRKTETELTDILNQAYQDDVSNYQNAIYEKTLANDEGFYGKVYEQIPDYLKTLADGYGIDLDNYKNVALAKAAINNKLIEELNKAWNSYVGDKTATTVGELKAEKSVINQTPVTDLMGLSSSIDGIVADLTTTIDLPKTSSGLKGGDKDTKEKEDANLKAFNKTKALYDHNLAMNLVSEKTYYNKLEILYKKHFSDKTKYLDEYRQYEEEVYNGREKLEQDSLDKANDKVKAKFDALKQSYDVGEITEEEYYSKLDKYNEKYYKNNEVFQSDYKQNLVELYQWETEQAEKVAQAKIDAFTNSEDTIIESFSNAISDANDAASNMTDGSEGQFSKYTDAIKIASNEVDYLTNEMQKLNKMYKAGTIDEDTYTERLKTLKGALDNVKDSTDNVQDSMAEAFSVNYNNVIDNLADSYETFTDKINDSYDAYEKLINAQKESLQEQKNADDYADNIADKTKDVGDIQTDMTTLKVAADTGDRDAINKLKDLQDELAEKKDDLTDTEEDHKLEVEENLLDTSLENYKTITDKQLSDAETVYNTKLENLKSLYAEEEKLISHASEYTQTEFASKMTSVNNQIQGILNSINDATNGNVSGVSSGVTKDIVDTQSDISSNSSANKSGLSDSSKNAIIKILNNGKGKDYEENASALAAYTRDNYGAPISKAQALEISKIFGISGISSVSDITNNDVAKQKILDALIGAGFKNGGVIGANTSLKSSLLSATGENVVLAASTGEGILSRTQTSALLGISNYLPAMDKMFANLASLKTPDLTKVITRSSGNTVTVNLESLLSGVTISPDYDILTAVKDNASKITEIIAKELR